MQLSGRSEASGSARAPLRSANPTKKLAGITGLVRSRSLSGSSLVLAAAGRGAARNRGSRDGSDGDRCRNGTFTERPSRLERCCDRSRGHICGAGGLGSLVGIVVARSDALAAASCEGHCPRRRRCGYGNGPIGFGPAAADVVSPRGLYYRAADDHGRFRARAGRSASRFRIEFTSLPGSIRSRWRLRSYCCPRAPR